MNIEVNNLTGLPELPEGMYWKVSETDRWLRDDSGSGLAGTTRLAYNLSLMATDSDEEGDDTVAYGVVRTREQTESLTALLEIREVTHREYSAVHVDHGLFRKKARLEMERRRKVFYAASDEYNNFEAKEYAMPLTADAILATAEILVRVAADFLEDYKNKAVSSQFVGKYPPLNLLALGSEV